MEKYFHTADSLSSEEGKSIIENDNEEKYFHPAGSLDFQEEQNVSGHDSIEEYISSVVTGKHLVEEWHGPTVCTYQDIVSIGEFKELVNKGYNIVRANYFKEAEMVEVLVEYYFEKNKSHLR